VNNSIIKFKLNKNIHSVFQNKLLLTDDNHLIIYDLEHFKILQIFKFHILPYILYEKNYLVIYDYNQIKVINGETEKIYEILKSHVHVNQQIAKEHDIIYNITISNDGNTIAINNGYKLQIINISNKEIKIINSDILICDIKFYQNDNLLISKIK